MTRERPEGDGPGDVDRLLRAISKGDAAAAEALVPIVYQELRALARMHLAGERAGHSLQATALVHEAYLRLIGDDPGATRWDSRAHFFGAAARAMRRILVDRARARGRLKRGGDRQRVALDDAAVLEDEPAVDLVALDAALDRLAAHDSRKHEVIMLRYFAGLTVEQTAATLGVSPATVKNDWSYARAWLHRELEGAGP